jgi:uncharacterized protein
LRSLIFVYARIFAPSPEKSLQSVIARHRELGNTRKTLAAMIRDGELRQAAVDGVSYVWPHDAVDVEARDDVRFLAPFDPVVWDRTRFEHLWGWAYRFEAYTPIHKRTRGYYAMPLLWRDRFIGWANASISDSRRRSGASAAAATLEVTVGYVQKRPRDPEFRRQLDAEIARLDSCVAPSSDISLASIPRI